MRPISLALVVAFAARTLVAQIELTPPIRLFSEAAQPSPRMASSLLAARSDDGFMALWTEDSLLRTARIDFSGRMVEPFAGVLDAPLLIPTLMASNGRDFLLVAYDQKKGASRCVRITAAGQLASSDGFSSGMTPISLVRSGDGYVLLLRVSSFFPESWQLIRLDADGNVVGSPGAFSLPAYDTPQLLVSADKLKLIWADVDGVHGADIDFDAINVRFANHTLLEPGLILSMRASDGPPGEIGIAYTPEPDRQIRFAVFSSTFHPLGNPIRLDTKASGVTSVAGTGYGYAIACSGPTEVLTIDSRGSGPRSGNLPGWTRVVSGPNGALAFWIDDDVTPQAHAGTIGGFEPFADRVVSLSEPEQKWPRLAQAGDLVAMAWVEVKHAISDVHVALVDPIAGAVVRGPVTIAEAPEFDDVAIAADAQRIVVVWSLSDTQGDGVVLDSALKPIAPLGLSPHDLAPHDVVPTANGFLIAASDREDLYILRNEPLAAAWGSVRLSTDVPDSVRLDLGATDVVLVSQVFVRSKYEGPDGSQIDMIVTQPGTIAGYHNRRTIDSAEALLGFARGDSGTLLLFFAGRTEIRSLDTLLLLGTVPNAAAKVLPWRSYADVRRSGNRITMSAGDVIETFDIAGRVLTTTPLGAGAQESRFIDGRRMVVVHDALATSGSRRLFLRFGALAPWHRAVGR